MFIRFHHVILGLDEVPVKDVQMLPLLKRHLLRLLHYTVDVADLQVHLTQRLLLLAQKPALQLVVEPLLYPSLPSCLLHSLLVWLHSCGVEAPGQFVAFLPELIADDHETFGYFWIEVALLAVAQHLLNSGNILLLLLEKGERLKTLALGG